MLLKKNTKEWEFMPEYCRPIELEIENTITDEGFEINSMDELVEYLAYWKFANDYVGMYWMREAIYNVATELGCIYEDINELVHDLRKYYI